MKPQNRESMHKLGKLLYIILTKYPSPGGLNYAWNYGVLGLLALGIQVVTGIVLAMFYTAHIDYAFYSVEHIMRDINLGYILRYTHATGASFFFIVIYAHILRGIWYGSYHFPRSPLWFTGILILFLMIITAFLGYLLPWGQMSFWGGTVITNLVTILPYGESIVEFLWGGFSVGNPTLNKFFALHFLLPFLLIVVVVGHLYFLHSAGSNNPLGIAGYPDKVSFGPYFIWKDLYFAILFCLAVFGVTFFAPNLLTDPDNYIEANPLVTPPHIVPEWYFLPYYAILRGIPNKTWGVLALLSSIVLIGLLPILHKARIRIIDFKPVLYLITVWWSLTFLFLFILGAAPIAEPWISVAGASINCFFIIFVCLTGLEFFELKLKNFMLGGEANQNNKSKEKHQVFFEFLISIGFGALIGFVWVLRNNIPRKPHAKPSDIETRFTKILEGFGPKPAAKPAAKPVAQVRDLLGAHEKGAIAILKKYNKFNTALPAWFVKELIRETKKDVSFSRRIPFESYAKPSEKTAGKIQGLGRLAKIYNSYKDKNVYVDYRTSASRVNKNILTVDDINSFGQHEYLKQNSKHIALRQEMADSLIQKTPKGYHTKHSLFYQQQFFGEILLVLPAKLPEGLPEKIFERFKHKMILADNTLIQQTPHMFNFFRVVAMTHPSEVINTFCYAASYELRDYLDDAAPNFDFRPFAEWKALHELGEFAYTSPIPEKFFQTDENKLSRIKELYTRLVLRYEVSTKMSTRAFRQRQLQDFLYYNFFCWYEDGLDDTKLLEDMVVFSMSEDPTLKKEEALNRVIETFSKFKYTKSMPVLSKDVVLDWKKEGALHTFVERYQDPASKYMSPLGFTDKIIFYDQSPGDELQERFSKNIFGPEGRIVKETSLFTNQIEMSEDLADFDFAALEAVADSNPETSDGALKYLIDFDKKLRGAVDVTGLQNEIQQEIQNDFGISLAIITILSFIGSGIALFRGYFKFNSGNNLNPVPVEKNDKLQNDPAPKRYIRLVPNTHEPHVPQKDRNAAHRHGAIAILKKYEQADAFLPFWFNKELIRETAKDVAHYESLPKWFMSYAIKDNPSSTEKIHQSTRLMTLYNIYKKKDLYKDYPNATEWVNKRVLTPEDIRAYGTREGEKLTKSETEMVNNRHNYLKQHTPDTYHSRHELFYRQHTLIDTLIMFPEKLPKGQDNKIFERFKVDLYAFAKMSAQRDEVNFFRVVAMTHPSDVMFVFCKAASTELGLYLKEVAPGYDFEPFIKWKTSKVLGDFAFRSPVPREFLQAPREKLTLIKDLYTRLVLRHEVVTAISTRAKRDRQGKDYLYYNFFCWYPGGLDDSGLLDDIVEFTLCKDPNPNVRIRDIYSNLQDAFSKFKLDRTVPVVSKEVMLRWKHDGTLQKIAEKYTQPVCDYMAPLAFTDKIIFFNNCSANGLEERFSGGFYYLPKRRAQDRETSLFLNQIERSEDLGGLNYAALMAIGDSNPALAAGAMMYLMEFDKRLRGETALFLNQIEMSEDLSGVNAEALMALGDADPVKVAGALQYLTDFHKKFCVASKDHNDSEGVLLSNDFGIGLGLWILGGGLGIIGLGGLFFWYKGVQEKRRICKILEETENVLFPEKVRESNNIFIPSDAVWYNTLVLLCLLKPGLDGSKDMGQHFCIYSTPSGFQIGEQLKQIRLFKEYNDSYLANMTATDLCVIFEDHAQGTPTETLQELVTEGSLKEFVENCTRYLEACNDIGHRNKVKVIDGMDYHGNFYKHNKLITPLVLLPPKLPVGKRQEVLKLLEKNLTDENGKYNFFAEFFQYAPGKQITFCRAATNEVLKNFYQTYWIAPIQKKHPYFKLDAFMTDCVIRYHKFYFDTYSFDKKMRDKFFEGLATWTPATKPYYEYLGYRLILFSIYLEQKKLAEDLKYPYETVMNLFPYGLNSNRVQEDVIRYIEEVDGPRTKAEILQIKADFFENHPNKKLFVTEAVISPDSFSNIPQETFKHIANIYGDAVWYIYQSNTLRQKLHDSASDRREFNCFYDLPVITVTPTTSVPLFAKNVPFPMDTPKSDIKVHLLSSPGLDRGFVDFCALMSEQRALF